jgi:thiol:disulfide interchange protein DsbD
MGFFASQGERRASRTFPLAAAYCLGLALTFTALGVAAAKAGSQFGLALESRWGVGAICLLMILLAASLFGLFELRVPGWVLGVFQGRRGLLGALIMGLAVGLVAAPCTGPYLAALVVFVAGRGRAAEGAATFFVLALGFGLPYLVLGTFTGLINRVPRGGGWLLWCKRALAFPVLGLVLYYLGPYLAAGLVWALAAGLALAGAIYLSLLEGRSRRPWSRAFVIVRVVAAALFLATAAGIFVTRAAPELGLVTRAAGPEISWRDYASGDLRLAGEAHRPVVLYFTAKWCSYCRTMDEKTFREAEVRRAAEGVSLLKIDGTNGFPEQGEAGELVRRYVHGGPPVLVFFDDQGRETAVRNAIGGGEFVELLGQITREK